MKVSLKTKESSEGAKKNRVLTPIRVGLVGPSIGVSDASYGSGVGGYVRNMEVYLSQGEEAKINYISCFTSVRKSTQTKLGLVKRLISDAVMFWRASPEIEVAHIMGQYRGAIIRELVIAFIAMLKGIPIVYEIKAGEFQSWFGKAPSPIRRLTLSMLRRSSLVLCEGVPDVEFLKTKFNLTSAHFPNVVPQNEIVKDIPERLVSDQVRILFTGYCYEGKGVFDLVDGVLKAQQEGYSVELTLVGAEEDSFKSYLDSVLRENPVLKVNRLGVMPHDDVIREMLGHDIFCMATDHRGEGHTNSINEALMTGMVVVCTQHGFLPTILSEENAYFVNKRNSDSIASVLAHITEARGEAKARAHAGRELFLSQYVAEPRFLWLEKSYRACIQNH